MLIQCKKELELLKELIIGVLCLVSKLKNICQIFTYFTNIESRLFVIIITNSDTILGFLYLCLGLKEVKVALPLVVLG